MSAKNGDAIDEKAALLAEAQAEGGFSTGELRLNLEELVFSAKAMGTEPTEQNAAKIARAYFSALEKIRALEEALHSGRLVWVPTKAG